MLYSNFENLEPPFSRREQSAVRHHILPAFRLWILLALVLSVAVAALAQDTNAQLSQIADSLKAARQQGYDLLSPKHFERAQAAYDEAKSLSTKKGQEDLVRIRLKLAQDELDSARNTAAAARQRLGEVMDARAAALNSGADSLSTNLWRKADERLRNALRDYEKSPGSANFKTEDLVGAFRAARRDALRTLILKTPRDRLNQVEHKRGEKEVPVLVLRAQQALSRAEADVAQEDLDAARANAALATIEANHALSFLDYISKVRKAKQPWESALLPYDDALDSIASYLGGSLDYTSGIGVYNRDRIISMIKSRQDSLVTLTSQQKQSIKTLEASLSDAQTKLADAQSRIAELQGRLGSAATPAQGAAATEAMARAQSVFHPGEAVVLQGENGSIVIRLAGTLFPAGATKLDKARQKVVDRVADAIGLFPGAVIRVEGHTDSLGGADKNMKISTDRAQSVASYLAAKLKIPSDKITAQGFGGTRPVAENSTAEGRARNRRVDVMLIFPR